MKKDINYKIKMNNGVEIPQLGLGVYLTKSGSECINAVTWALEAGYRHIDTAKFYKNEKDVGEAVRNSGIKREEIFVTTKLWNEDHGYESALRAFDKSLKELNIDYIDCYLIHWPVQEKRKDSWKALEKIYESGYCKSIGVSNYMIPHLEELFTYANVIPVMNQVEFNPFNYQNDLLDFCNKNKIILEAYAPLTRSKRINDKTLLPISQKHKKSNAQVLIRWAIQHELVVIPKSVHKERIIENANVFDFTLDESDMKILDNMNDGFRSSWDPTKID
ncbi:MAG TPA: aldo/keto reductase [Ignavibacteriaceae bacterium]|jgi:diketogulonate reductase-like aldo/keto reductase|nr:MAG: Glyoxal reductase [Ignavibacteria bacterium ADurb.Bin266]OQY71470.1 MAG: aldo/keto reductase [Ignavibacteriales bacterium UTCHB2]HQF43598.1 aldo/keto reductase [Ignavibacteriaceae bacterium]HQI40235.1 aldo/keto reductase [Ignavibacteriaceae bacterium]HQJ46636.1 aldo/keto reductase [Ignavibacteriaceae bacterium]